MNYRLPKKIKNLMEREIRQYKCNKKKLENLKNDSNCNATRKFLYLEERIHYVEQMFNELNTQEQKVFNLIFNENCNWLYCKTVYNIDKSTYYNVYNKSLFFLAQEWGII